MFVFLIGRFLRYEGLEFYGRGKGGLGQLYKELERVGLEFRSSLYFIYQEFIFFGFTIYLVKRFLIDLGFKYSCYVNIKIREVVSFFRLFLCVVVKRRQFCKGLVGRVQKVLFVVLFLRCLILGFLRIICCREGISSVFVIVL